MKNKMNQKINFKKIIGDIFLFIIHRTFLFIIFLRSIFNKDYKKIYIFYKKIYKNEIMDKK